MVTEVDHRYHIKDKWAIATRGEKENKKTLEIYQNVVTTPSKKYWLDEFNNTKKVIQWN